MDIYIQTTAGYTMVLTVQADWRVGDLYNELSDDHILMHQGEDLIDRDATLADLGIGSECMLQKRLRIEPTFYITTHINIDVSAEDADRFGDESISEDIGEDDYPDHLILDPERRILYRIVFCDLPIEVKIHKTMLVKTGDDLFESYDSSVKLICDDDAISCTISGCITKNKRVDELFFDESLPELKPLREDYSVYKN